MPIRRLPPLLVNQIAAGEVIERPASVVKELVENAIDARATRIAIEIEDGGRELIRVIDDGVGIDEAELPLALAPHATSKIEKQEDLDAIGTLGFRGEALASIASVSRVMVLSRPRSAVNAALIEAEGELIHPPRPASGPPGTAVTVRNLFFNTPARRKFLRSATTEATRIAEMVESIALAHPAIAFSLRHEQRMTLDLPAADSPRRRALEVLGRELEPHLLDVHLDAAGPEGVSGWGLVGTPQIARGNANHQRLYLNGRPIRDRSLQHALKEAYRGLIEPGRYPTILLFLEMDPRQVDVNVHPTKAEVRFRNQSLVHQAVLHAVRARLRKADLVPALELDRAHPGGGSGAAASWQLTPAFGPSSTPTMFPRSASGSKDAGHAVAPVAGEGSPREGDARPITSARDFVDYFRRLDPVQKGFVYAEVKQAVAGIPLPDVQNSGPAVGGAGVGGTGVGGTGVPPASSDSSSPGVPPAAAAGSLPAPTPAASILQVHASYLVTQDAQGLVIIDQHALHERYMFERLLERLSHGPLESQRLLMPDVIDLDRALVERAEELAPLFAQLGIDAEPMSRTSLAVHAFPSFLLSRGVEPAPFLRELLERAAAGTLGEGIEAALHETLDMMACKAAVKAGDRLAPEELSELLAVRERLERSSNCPHGRPTTLRLTIHELDRQFGRG